MVELSEGTAELVPDLRGGPGRNDDPVFLEVCLFERRFKLKALLCVEFLF